MSDQRPRAASIRDVARVAGVSHQTVSRVLNGHPSIRDTTRVRVTEAMAELRYRPNRAARMLVTSRSRTLGVLLASSPSNYGPAQSVAAVEDAARESGYSVTIATVGTADRLSVEAAVDHLLAQSVEGVVVVAPQQQVVDVLRDQPLDLPFVSLQSAIGSDGRTFSVDQVAGARLAAVHLVALGHRAIGHLAGPPDWIEAAARRRGFEDAVAAADLPVVPVHAGDWSADSGFEAGRALLAEGPTAVFAANDQMALGLIHAAHAVGLHVPDDLSVVGFDDIPEAAHLLPALTTVRQDFAELGRRSVAELLASLGAGHPPYGGSVEPELVVRASTAPPRG